MRTFRFRKILAFIILISILLAPTSSFAQAEGSSGVASFLNSFFPEHPSKSVKPVLSEEDLANVTKPAVVRIIQQTKGNFVINTNFDLDLLNFRIIPRRVVMPVTLPVDTTMTGTGFIITPTGYIMTNAHVVSSEVIKFELMAEGAEKLFLGYASELNAAQVKAFQAKISTPAGKEALIAFAREVIQYLMDRTDSQVKTTITVLNPSSSKNSILELVKDGFPAEVVAINDGFVFNQKDAALIKIEESDLPSIPIAEVDANIPSAVVGQKLFAFGFPSTADFGGSLGQKGFLEPSFSSGVVSAFKDSINKDFKLIQSDVKISTGSSGSPALNAKGEVIGMITFETNKEASAGGDIFSFAVPLGVILPLVTRIDVVPETGKLYTHFFTGYEAMVNKHCTVALEEFEEAKKVNSKFTSAEFLDPYISKCEAMIASGESIDGEWDLFFINVKSKQTVILGSLAGAFITLIFLIIFFWLIRKLRKDEKMIENLTHPAPVPEHDLSHPLPTAATVAPPDRTTLIANFIKENRQKGMTDAQIVVALRALNYSDIEISTTFAKKEAL